MVKREGLRRGLGVRWEVHWGGGGGVRWCGGLLDVGYVEGVRWGEGIRWRGEGGKLGGAGGVQFCREEKR